jgi:hypothetical protein
VTTRLEIYPAGHLFYLNVTLLIKGEFVTAI